MNNEIIEQCLKLKSIEKLSIILVPDQEFSKEEVSNRQHNDCSIKSHGYQQPNIGVHLPAVFEAVKRSDLHQV